MTNTLPMVKITTHRRHLSYLFLILFLFIFSTEKITAQCTVDATICTPGVSPAFGFTATGGAYAGGSFVNAGCNTGMAGNHSYGFITLHITESGPLNLLVNGNSNNGYIDVAIFNVPEGVAPCNAIQNAGNVIGCNYADFSGGCVQFGNAFGCNSDVPAPNVVAGQEIMIIVQNYSNPGSTSFTLELGPPPGAQTGPADATIAPVGPVCISSSSFQLNAASMGGNWSGPGVSATGIFNPAAAGPGTHTINYSIGSFPCNSSDQTTITVEPLPTTNAGSDVTICAGESVTLTATGASTFNWNNGLGGGASHSVSPGVTTTYTVTGGSAAGCVSTDQVTVNVNPLPTVGAGANVSICQGASTTLTATGANSYTWDNGLGAGASHTVSPGATTTYTVTGTTNGCQNTSSVTVSVTPLNVTSSADVTICQGQSTTISAAGATNYSWDNGVGAGASHTVSPATTTTYTVTGSSGGCSNTSSTTVNVTPLPVVSAGSDQAICVGDAATITATGATNYNWDNGLGAGASHSVSPGSTTTYTVTGSSSGCTNTDQIQVVVNPNPIVNAGTDQVICAGESVTLSATGSADNFSWNNGVVDGVAFTPTTTTTYTLTGTNATGCAETDQVTVTVNPLPVVDGGIDQAVCEGSTVTLTATGNATGYTWDNSVTNGVAFTPGVGTVTYTVTGTSAAGCTNTDQVDVTVYANPVVDAGSDFSVCIGTPVTLTGSGANTYSWTNGVTDGVTFTPGGTATYTVTGTDNNGCQDTDAITVIVLPDAPIDAGADQVICEGESTTITATGGVTYTWDNGLGVGASHTISPATTTTYTVNGEDANGCTGSDQVTVTVNPLPTATINGTTDVCQNDVFPSVTFTGANGTAPYTFTYTINGGATQTVVSTGNSATVSAPTGSSGTFTYELVSVQDASSTTCAQNQTGTAIILVNPLPTATIAGTTVVCQNDASPSVTFTGANGTAPYTFTYTINGGATQTVVSTGNSATVSAPTGSAGTFTYELVSVQDASSTTCIQNQTGTATIQIDPLPTATIAGTTVVCQNDASPSVTFTGANGTAPYTFTYTINGGAAQTVISTGNTAMVSIPTGTVGTYTIELVNVEDASASVCQQTQTGTVTVVVNPLPTAILSGDTEICQNSASPSVTFTGANGTAPYTFTYTINGGANQTVTSVGNTVTVSVPTGSAGTFVYDLISVQDASSTTCSQAQTGTATIVVNPLPTATITGTTDVCQDGTSPSVTFTGANGTAPYTFTYNINGGASQTVVSTGNTATVSVPTGAAGTFNYNLLSVQDASSTACVQSQAGTVTVIVNPLPTAIISGATEVCENDAPPSVTFTGANGTAPYTFTYSISGGAAQTVTSTGNSAIVSVPTGSAGSFTYELISVEDASSTLCSQPQTGGVTITVNPLPTATIMGTTEVCQNGTSPVITFTGANGTAPYTFSYTINNGAVQTVTSTGNSATVSVPTGVAGTFVYELVNVEDASSTSCSQSQSDLVTVLVNPLPTATITGTTEVCQNDASPSVTFTGANGTAPYTFTYTINGGAAQTVVSVGNTAQVIVPTGTVGNFIFDLVAVQDASLTTCSQAQSGSATISVNPLPTATISGTTEICQNATSPSVTFTGADGTAPYTFTYTINGGASQTVTSVGNNATVTVSTLVPGTYTYDLISVEDASSTTCSQLQTGSVNIIVNPLPTATIFGTTSICVGDPDADITISGSNGTAPYTFTYTINGGSNQTITSTGDDAIVTIPSSVAGTFNVNLVSVEDASSTTCFQSETGTATVTVNSNPVPVITGADEYCEGYSAGLNAGSGYIAYNWSTGASSQTITATEADNPITVTVTSPEGCIGTSAPFTVTENLDIVTNYSFQICQGESMVIHGLPQTTSGTYSQTFVSATGCDSIANVTLVVNPLPAVFAGTDYSICTGASTTLNGSGAVTYVWDNSVTNGVSFTPGTTQTYTVTGTDANGCVNTDNVVVTLDPLPTATVSGTTIVCQNDASPDITFTGAGATAPYTFTYTVNGGTVQTVTSTGDIATVSVPTGTVGTFTYNLIRVEESGSNTCSQGQTGTETVTVNPLPTATISGNAEVCQDGVAPVITLTGANGVAPYTFTYTINGGTPQTVVSSGNQATLSVPTSTAGTYVYDLVSVQDSSPTNCSQTQSGTVSIQVNPLPLATIDGDAIVCRNGAAPTVTFTGSNGTAPYTFSYTINGGAIQTVVSTGSTANISAPTGVVGTFVYDLISVQDASSTTCSQSQSGSVTIQVNPLPTATVTGTTEVCQNSTSPNVTFTGANGTAPYTFTYTINGGANQSVTSTGNSVTVSVPTGTVGTFNYNLISVQDASSTACIQNQSGVASVLVNPLPTATISGDAEVCQSGTSPTVTFVGSNSTAPYTFTYRINGGASQTVTSVGNTATVSVPTGIVGTYTYELISVQDASSTTCSQNQSGSVTIIVNPLPTATISGTTIVCQNEASPDITFTGANGTAPYTFTYTINGGTVQTVTSTGNTAIVSVPTGTVGTFNYSLISVQDASSTACIQNQSGNASVTVNPLPTAIVSGTTEVCQNATQPVVTFTGANGTAPYTFRYTINGGAVVNVTSTGNSATVSAPTGTVGTFVYELVGVQDASATACYQNQSGSTTITVNPLPTATIAGTTVVCQNDTEPQVTFIGANGTAPYTFTYTINGGAAQTVVSTGNIATVDVPTGTVGTLTYSLVSVQDASSTACIQNQSGTVSITVNPLPTATISGTTDVCQNGTSPMITFSGNNGTAPYTFTYSINGGTNQIVVSTGNSATVSVPTGVVGSFSYELISVQDGSSTTCSQSQSGTSVVTVHPLPTATINGDTEVCQNAAEPIITFTGAGGTAPYTFTYSINGGPGQTVVSSGTTATVSVPTTVYGTFTYSLLSVSDAGVVSCEQTQNGSATVIVNRLPEATISGNADLCINGAASQVTFTGVNGTAPYTFTYTINGGANQTIVSTGNTVSITVPTNAIGAYQYELVGVQDASTTACVNTETGSVLVTVHDLPTVFAGNDIVSCAGETVLLTASGAVTYVWDNGVYDGVPFIPLDTTVYTVTGTDQYGCQNTDDLTVYVVPNPVVTFVADTLEGCSPLTVTFTNQSTGNLDNCQWTFSDGTVATGCSSVTHNFTQPGCYSVALTATTIEGCRTSYAEQDMICVYPDPVANFYTEPSGQMTTVSPTLHIFNTSVDADSYYWNFGNESFSTETSPTVTYAEQPGVYDITLYAMNNAGCVDSITRQVQVVQEVIYYVPNAFTPDNDEFNETFTPVFSQGFDPYDYNLLIFNRWGEVLFESNDAEFGWDGTYGGQLVEDGVYVWRISFKNETTDRREVITGHVTLIR
ncbi:hypothetical protein GCM10009118_10520 [Wandonia haliotis]|uniref:PKD domain-containing protein n=2 Tax=Wandonia haliotis TaxID=574963 RepID=A0ABN1MMX4_9FLAO